MELLLINAKVYTRNPRQPQAQALLIREGRVAAAGDNRELMKQAGPRARVMDLKGRMVLPGLTDSHMHVAHMSLASEEVSLYGLTSLSQIGQAVADFIREKQLAPGTWVRGSGWNQDLFEDKRLPTRRDLDAVSTEHPIALNRVCGHCTVVNTCALEARGITAATPQVPGGSFELGEDGQPNGRFFEDAMALVNQREPMTTGQVENLLLSGLERAASLGLTCVHSDDLMSLPCSWRQVMEAYRRLDESGRMPVRVVEQCLLPDEAVLDAFFAAGYGPDWRGKHFSVGPLKLLADGSLGARSAYLKKPYHDDPTTRGIALYTRRQLNRLVAKAHGRGMATAVHAIGDEAIDMVLEAVEYAQRRCPNRSIRHGIVHCQITDETLLRRIRGLRMQVYAQPVFLEYDLHMADDRVGEKLASTSYAFATMRRLGIPVSGGSDCPVEDLDPLKGLYCAVTRQDYQGLPQGGWHPQEKLTLPQALELYTTAGAYAAGMESRRGQLAPGMEADVTVLDRDLFELAPEQIPSAQVEMTIMDGEIRFGREKI